jgi:predicted aspartyl protease
MDKVEFIKVLSLDGTEVEHAIIDHGNDQFTSMPKTIFDEIKSNEATAK